TADIRLVFMARVHPLKGVNTIFKLARTLVEKDIKNVQIDVYGPIFPDYSSEFSSLLSNHVLVEYKGVVQPENIPNILANYDLMLFPTQYYTEGFPGSILDAYIAHVP